jgi:hypothetical protein
MSVVGLRVGPFEIHRPAEIPQPGRWFHARRADNTSRKKPTDVVVRLLQDDAGSPMLAELQGQFDRLRALDDARIPSAVSFFEGAGAMVLNHIEGAQLSEVVACRSTGEVALTPATLLDIAIEVSDALIHAHHRGIAHGHLSPHNVLIAPSGALHVIGFGLVNGEPTPGYWAPEVANDAPRTAATDQWAVAGLIVASITGKPLWSDLNEAKLGDAGPPLRRVAQQWPALGRVLGKMLQERPANRYQGMSAARAELAGLARKAGGASSRRDLGALMYRRGAEEDVPVQFAAATPVSAPARLDSEEIPPTEETELHVASSFDLSAAVLDDLPLPPPKPMNEQDAAEAVDRAVASARADLEPSEATELFDAGPIQDLLQAEVAIEATDPDDGPIDSDPGVIEPTVDPAVAEADAEQTDATVVFEDTVLRAELASAGIDDGILLEASPTAVPVTDPDDLGDLLVPDDVSSEPAIGDAVSTVQDLPFEEELVAAPAIIVRAASWLAATFVILMIVWVVSGWL